MGLEFDCSMVVCIFFEVLVVECNGRDFLIEGLDLGLEFEFELDINVIIFLMLFIVVNLGELKDESW